MCCRVGRSRPERVSFTWRTQSSKCGTWRRHFDSKPVWSGDCVGCCVVQVDAMRPMPSQQIPQYWSQPAQRLGSLRWQPSSVGACFTWVAVPVFLEYLRPAQHKMTNTPVPVPPAPPRQACSMRRGIRCDYDHVVACDISVRLWLEQ